MPAAAVRRLDEEVFQVDAGPAQEGREVVEEQGKTGGLAIDLQARRRVKLYGRMAAGALKETSGKDVAEASLLVKIEQSLGKLILY